MVAEKNSIIRDIKAYITVLRENGIPIEKAVLFGSWARGTANENSDVDVALVSSFFTGDRFMDRRKIIPFRRTINNNIEPLPFSVEDFAINGILVSEIKRYGEEIV